MSPLPKPAAWTADALCREHPEVDFFPSDSPGVDRASHVRPRRSAVRHGTVEQTVSNGCTLIRRTPAP